MDGGVEFAVAVRDLRDEEGHVGQFLVVLGGLLGEEVETRFEVGTLLKELPDFMVQETNKINKKPNN